MRRLAPLALLALAGCTVGPHASQTDVPLPPPATPAIIAPVSGPAQTIVPGGEVGGAWWQAFGSAKLDTLVTRALATNNDIAAAEATLRQAAEQARGVAGSTGPQIDANYQAQRVRISRTLSNPLSFDPNQYVYTLHTAQVTVAYPLDLFGAGRNRVRSARAAAEVAAHRRDAARNTVVANLVLAVIQHAALAQQVADAQAAITSNRQLIELLNRRRAIGDIGEADVVAQATALATAEAALPPLQRQLHHQEGLIATLTGAAPGGPTPDLPGFDELRLPGTLPVALPAAIIANRPDVRAVDAQVRGAAADLGSAIAARLPQIQLTGTGGGQATDLAQLLTPGNLFYTLVGGVTQPLFHSGQLLHQQRAARAALATAQAQYRAAALGAFLDVDDALAGLRADATALDAATRARTAAARSLQLTRRQVELGAIGTLQLLNASAADAQAALQLSQARAARLADTVALFQATGIRVDAASAR